MSTFEIAKSSSTFFSNSRHKFGLRYSNQFNCSRGNINTNNLIRFSFSLSFVLKTWVVWSFSSWISGLFLKSYSASDDGSYLTDKGVVYSVGSDDFAALTTSSHSVNGSTSSLYYRNLILGAFDDEYGGVVIDPNRLPQNSYAFASMLCLSLSHWKKLVNSSIHVYDYLFKALSRLLKILHWGFVGKEGNLA